ncbi:MAG TPA: prepilin-type N-terminal cleavage/methylation domain-containing protein [Fimbriimonas sp.]|nr:prepilin-type N-terminal cleavage/methylation domain-containing protein [Fimbriimonas sp.]
MKKAFTLIELLVVIAIIAILAAILFPVFAQAKVAAKKAQSISNVKQITTSALIYMADVDDIMPITRGNNGVVNDGAAIVYQSDETLTTPSPVTRSMWANAMTPYIKNRDIWRIPVGTDFVVFAGETEAQLGTQRYGYSINAYVNAFTATAVVESARTVLFQENPRERQTRKYFAPFPLATMGNGTTTPNFEQIIPWQFQRNADTLTVFLYQVDKTWFNYGQTQCVSYLDGHAKSLPTRGRDSYWKITDTAGIPYPAGWSSAGINVEAWEIGKFWYRPNGLVEKA